MNCLLTAAIILSKANRPVTDRPCKVYWLELLLRTLEVVGP